MEMIKGKQVYSELTELVNRDHAALMIIDMQKEGVSQDGYFAKRLGAAVSVVADLVKPLADFLGEARAAIPGVRRSSWSLYPWCHSKAGSQSGSPRLTGRTTLP